jgi:hypothetical protein
VSDRGWRDAHFGRRDAIARLGLIRAPTRSTPSHELTAARELEQREVDYWREVDRRLHEQSRQAARRRLVESLRPMVEEFGAEVVERVERQRDPSFTLPVELQERSEDDGH